MLDLLFTNVAKNLADPIIKQDLKAVGLDTQEKAEAAFAKGLSPDQILVLKSISADLRSQELDNADRNSAREMQMVTKDRIVPILGFSCILIPFAVIALLFIFDIPTGNKEMIQDIMKGLVPLATLAASFYFGASNEKGKV